MEKKIASNNGTNKLSNEKNFNDDFYSFAKKNWLKKDRLIEDKDFKQSDGYFSEVKYIPTEQVIQTLFYKKKENSSDPILFDYMFQNNCHKKFIDFVRVNLNEYNKKFELRKANKTLTNNEVEENKKKYEYYESLTKKIDKLHIKDSDNIFNILKKNIDENKAPAPSNFSEKLINVRLVSIKKILKALFDHKKFKENKSANNLFQYMLAKKYNKLFEFIESQITNAQNKIIQLSMSATEDQANNILVEHEKNIKDHYGKLLNNIKEKCRKKVDCSKQFVDYFSRLDKNSLSAKDLFQKNILEYVLVCPNSFLDLYSSLSSKSQLRSQVFGKIIAKYKKDKLALDLLANKTKGKTFISTLLKGNVNILVEVFSYKKISNLTVLLDYLLNIYEQVKKKYTDILNQQNKQADIDQANVVLLTQKDVQNAKAQLELFKQVLPQLFVCLEQNEYFGDLLNEVTSDINNMKNYLIYNKLHNSSVVSENFILAMMHKHYNKYNKLDNFYVNVSSLYSNFKDTVGISLTEQDITEVNLHNVKILNIIHEHIKLQKSHKVNIENSTVINFKNNKNKKKRKTAIVDSNNKATDEKLNTVTGIVSTIFEKINALEKLKLENPQKFAKLSGAKMCHHLIFNLICLLELEDNVGFKNNILKAVKYQANEKKNSQTNNINLQYVHNAVNNYVMQGGKAVNNITAMSESLVQLSKQGQFKTILFYFYLWSKRSSKSQFLNSITSLNEIFWQACQKQNTEFVKNLCELWVKYKLENIFINQYYTNSTIKSLDNGINNTSILNYVVENKANSKHINSIARTILESALQLQKKGVLVLDPQSLQTAFYIAALNDKADLVIKLLAFENRDEIQQQYSSENDKNILDLLCFKKSWQIIEHILNSKIQLNYIPIYVFIEHGQALLVKKSLSLLKAALKLNREIALSTEQRITNSKKRTKKTKSQPKQNYTLLMHAIRHYKNDSKIIVEIIETYPEQITVVDKNKHNIFHHIAAKNNSKLFKIVLQEIEKLENSANILQELFEGEDKKFNTPLCNAVLGFKQKQDLKIITEIMSYMKTSKIEDVQGLFYSLIQNPNITESVYDALTNLLEFKLEQYLKNENNNSNLPKDLMQHYWDAHKEHLTKKYCFPEAHKKWFPSLYKLYLENDYNILTELKNAIDKFELQIINFITDEISNVKIDTKINVNSEEKGSELESLNNAETISNEKQSNKKISSEGLEKTNNKKVIAPQELPKTIQFSPVVNKTFSPTVGDFAQKKVQQKKQLIKSNSEVNIKSTVEKNAIVGKNKAKQKHDDLYKSVLKQLKKKSICLEKTNSKETPIKPKVEINFNTDIINSPLRTNEEQRLFEEREQQLTKSIEKIKSSSKTILMQNSEITENDHSKITPVSSKIKKQQESTSSLNLKSKQKKPKTNKSPINRKLDFSNAADQQNSIQILSDTSVEENLIKDKKNAFTLKIWSAAFIAYRKIRDSITSIIEQERNQGKQNLNEYPAKSKKSKSIVKSSDEKAKQIIKAKDFNNKPGPSFVAGFVVACITIMTSGGAFGGVYYFVGAMAIMLPGIGAVILPIVVGGSVLGTGILALLVMGIVSAVRRNNWRKAMEKNQQEQELNEQNKSMTCNTPRIEELDVFPKKLNKTGEQKLTDTVVSTGKSKYSKKGRDILEPVDSKTKKLKKSDLFPNDKLGLKDTTVKQKDVNKISEILEFSENSYKLIGYMAYNDKVDKADILTELARQSNSYIEQQTIEHQNSVENITSEKIAKHLIQNNTQNSTDDHNVYLKIKDYISKLK